MNHCFDPRLDAHPQELLVMWVSRHGNVDQTGTEQYPGTTAAERQAFFKQAGLVLKMAGVELGGDRESGKLLER